MLLKQDVLDLAALAALCVAGPEKSRILNVETYQANSLIDLFHALLETNVTLEEWYQRCFFNAFVKLSKKTGYCPTSLYLSEGSVEIISVQNQGGFGVVHQGRFGSCTVAVKELKRDAFKSAYDFQKNICKEAIVWRHLRHPNCLPFYGIYNIPGRMPQVTALVSPWMQQGTLRGYLESNPHANRTMLILDVVRGLNYLHSMQPHVAHRDLKPDNIFITRAGRACLADFGLVSTFDADTQFRTATNQLAMGGTRCYMAPELHAAETEEQKRKVNKRACDMYALGCTIYAAYTGRNPFDGVRPDAIPAEVREGRRPEFPPNGTITPDMWSFIENLWSGEPFERLPAQKAVAWMVHKAAEEGIDTALSAFEKEWEWKAMISGGPLCVSLD
ncbi:kinase-like domain-containing protein [Melanogaster broomeanus]|nr:kinase-like domain-containing protein [Melanogaster broomeanus]